MTPLLAGKDASAGAARAGEYARHRPEQTLLYQLVEAHSPAFVEHLAARERTLPAHVQREFEAYLKCGRLEHGFLRVRCADCHAERLVAFSCKRGFCPSCGARRMAEGAALLVDEVLPREPMRQWVLSVPFALRYLFATDPAVMGQVLGIVYRAIASQLIKAAGYQHETAQTGAVTLIQRFGSALNLNIHFHMLFLDGVYVTSGERLSFRRVPPPTVAALEALVRVISERVGRALERQGLLVRDLENSFLMLDSPDGAGFDDLLGHSITYRIALGPQQGRKAFTLQTVPAATEALDGNLARAAGFSLHAGVASEAHEREKLEQRLCRYITRPAVSTERLSLTAQGNIRYRLKTPYRDGTTDVVFEPLDFMARLAALVPTPRVNLTRYHGVFAPNHRLREQVTPARRGRRKAETANEPAPARHVSMTWAQRLKRVFKIDILTCEHCGGAVKVIASIEDPSVIKKILDHLARRAEATTPVFRPFARAPPHQQLPGLKEPG